MTSEAEVYAAVNEIFADVFMRDDLKLTPAMTAKDVQGWDSFKQIEIIMAAEERYGIKFNTRELDSLQNVEDLVKMIERKTA